MQPMRCLSDWLMQNAHDERYLFRLHDLRALLPNISDNAFTTLMNRMTKRGDLERVCRGIYMRKQNSTYSGLELFHIAALLRANTFNYLSLETLLSGSGIISQVPINWITLMSSGRSNIISCGQMGTIEFVHTNQSPGSIVDQLTYDKDYKLWKASISQAIRDMKATHRNCDLINWEIANEFI